MSESQARKTQVFEGDISDQLLSTLELVPFVAVDTETSGLDWSIDELHLCQLYAPGVGAVLVRPGGRAPKNLKSLLENPTVGKVFHYAPFDLRFLASKWNIQTSNVRCTKTANKLLAPSAPAKEHSLGPLVKRIMGISLDKGAVRTSDWGASELSEDQIDYAARDVIYLLELHHHLESDLEKIGLRELYDRVCDYLPVGVYLEVNHYPNPLEY